jgi:hypothetical protein
MVSEDRVALLVIAMLAHLYARTRRVIVARFVVQRGCTAEVDRSAAGADRARRWCKAAIQSGRHCGPRRICMRPERHHGWTDTLERTCRIRFARDTDYESHCEQQRAAARTWCD